MTNLEKAQRLVVWWRKQCEVENKKTSDDDILAAAICVHLDALTFPLWKRMRTAVIGMWNYLSGHFHRGER